LAHSSRDKEHLGIDSNVLIAYLVQTHPDHQRVIALQTKHHAVNPTVIHETYHTFVFKLKVEPKVAARLLLEYIKGTLFLDIKYSDTEIGLKIASEYGLGGRDSLILAPFVMSPQVTKFITFDSQLLNLKISYGDRKLAIISPDRL